MLGTRDRVHSVRRTPAGPIPSQSTRSMPEGRVYVTSWARTATGGYRVWVKRNKKLFAEGATFAEADSALSGVICIATGDGESVHQYVPPQPDIESAGEIERAQLWLLGAEGRAEMASHEGLFAGGLCDHCLKPRGPRTDQPLALASIDSGYQAARAHLPKKTQGGASLKVYSEEFVSLLTPAERASFEWRPVAPNKRRKRQFFEAIERAEPAPWVSVIGRDTYYARCPECSWTWVIPNYRANLPFYMMSEVSLPNPLPTLLAFGRRPGIDLVANPDRWAEMAGRAGTKGIKASVVSVVAESAVERAPVYRQHPREGWKLRQ